GHGRLQHHAIKKQKPRTWRGFVSNLKPACCAGFETGRRRNAPPNGLARPTTNLLLSGSTGS
ncbi:hypothetical protein, partial [Burkholderia pseudomallei]|uniref:hypothetical protein n=1 Tax=Burkholderia pseudomallei TaxID=28450 RepID=UPI001C4AD298